MISIEISVPIGRGHSLKGNLEIPSNSNAVVIFSDCRGRFNPANKYFASVLNGHGIATFLPDLLTNEEVDNFDNRYNIDLLTERLLAVVNYAIHLKNLYNLPVGLMGASTGSSAALRIAAQLPDVICALALDGGRAALASTALKMVKQPTLLIAGENTELNKLNQQAFSKLTCEKEYRTLYEARDTGRRFVEAGELALHWFAKHLSRSSKLAA